MLNILVVTPAFEKSLSGADPECMHRIRAVSPKIRVKDGAALVAAEFRGDHSQKKKLNSLLAWADVIFGLAAPPDTVARAPNLKWIQVISAGVDRWMATDVWNSRVILTGVSGIHATPVGEFAMALMLMFAKNAPCSFRMRQTRQWQHYPTHSLRGKTVGIVGLGHIGKEIARLSKALGMTVIATRRSVLVPGKTQNVDLLLPQSQIQRMLRKSDFIVLSVPLTPETRHIIGESELRAMKPGARLINVGRGQLVDEEALIRALDEKRIAGAGLDVTYTEPLPKESRLWILDNVILSPHLSWAMENYLSHATHLFCKNLRRYLSGKKLLNMVDPKRGY
jgi:phosphoglycerate dehydrogenase-like enzyme